jgi:hypothetical protein
MCQGRGSGRFVRRFLDTKDSRSTSNLRRHAKICFGAEAVAAADSAASIADAREVLDKMKVKDQSITTLLERIGVGKKSYNQRNHSKAEIRWVHSAFSFLHI